MQRSLIDAGPLIALFDRDDHYHEYIVDFLKNFKGILFTTLPVITEVMYMLNFNTQVQIDFLEWIKKEGLKIAEIDIADIKRIIELTKKYKDRPLDFADGSLIVTSEKSGIDNIITIDSDFYFYRAKGIKKFIDLFEIDNRSKK
jgi:uncharacterized protein